MQHTTVLIHQAVASCSEHPLNKWINLRDHMWAGCSSLLSTRRMVVILLCLITLRRPALCCSPHLFPQSCKCPIHPPVFPQTPWPDNWDAYSNSLYIVFPLYRVGSGLVEMVVGTTRKPSSLEVNFVTLFMFCKTDSFLWEGLKPKPLGKSYSYISISHCQQSPISQRGEE